MACDKKETAKEICVIIGASLRLRPDSFAYLGLVKDYNGIDIHQAWDHIKVLCSNYINRIMSTHGWETSSKNDNINTAIQLRSNVLNLLSNHTSGPKEGTKEHLEIYKTNKDSHTKYY